MPIALDPNARLNLVLDADLDKPAETRPTFLAHYMTSSERDRVEQNMREAAKDIELPANVALLEEGLGILLTGWRNLVDREGQPIPFAVQTDADGMRRVPTQDILTHDERFDLVIAGVTAARLGEMDKKKLRLLARSASAATSAGTAAQRENVTLPPANPTPSASPAQFVTGLAATTAPVVTASEPTPSSSAPSSS